MTKHFATGLVVGKFAPLHLGHELLIRSALAECGELVLVSYCDPEPPGCEAARRKQWLAARFPGATLLVGDRTRWPDLPRDDAGDAPHRAFVARILRRKVDAVYTSEAYGEGFAATLGAQHVLVDLERRSVPISATRIRSDVHAHRRFLAPHVYASFVERVVLLGGESTGKSTLAAALAGRHRTQWVPEFGRELWIEREGELTFDDFALIARTQVAREEAALLTADRFLFCDTSPLTTLFYSLHSCRRAAPELLRLATRTYHRTLLCAPDFPFVQDGTRPDPTLRERQHVWYCDELARRGIAFRLLSGPLAERLAAFHD